MNDFQGVFFDLDGTLIDTAPDMGLALNLLLRNHQRDPLDMDHIRPQVSHGSAALVKLGFGIDESSDRFEPLKQEFLDLYEKNVAVGSKLFSGMESVLDSLEAATIPWGIVTNKPGYLTDQLLDKLKLDRRASSVISGDTLKVRKPNPQPLYKACEIAAVSADQCLYVGDAQRDIQAAKAAGMKSCAALYGYYTKDENPASWQADYYINSAQQLSNYINFEIPKETALR